MSAPLLPDRCQRLPRGAGGRLAESRAEPAAAAQPAYTVSLTDRLPAEADARPQRSIPSRTPMAPRPYHQTRDPVDCGFPPRIDERPGRERATLQGGDAAAHLVCLGPPGVGKPRRAPPWTFVTMQDLVADRRQPWHANRFSARLALYTRPKRLGIDEVGSLARDRLEANLFFRVIRARYETGRLALTSHKGFSAWGEIVGDPVRATAILDRLLHPATILNIRGESYRRKDKKRVGGWAPPTDPTTAAAR